MLSISLDSILEKKVKKFAEENNISAEELIETIIYDFIDTVEEKSGPIKIYEDVEESYNEADFEYLQRAMGFKPAED